MLLKRGWVSVLRTHDQDDPKKFFETNRGKVLAAMVAAGLFVYTVEYDKDAF